MLLAGLTSLLALTPHLAAVKPMSGPLRHVAPLLVTPTGPPPRAQTATGPDPPTGAGRPSGGGPPRGGPPPQTFAQKLLDQVFEGAFKLLYAFEPDGMLDSSKNLRVLWVRALLAASGELDDDVAKELLPSSTRWPVVPKLMWIKQRTEFIDSITSEYIKSISEGKRGQAVLIGSGYDTRALRFRSAPVDFYEVDLENVLKVKKLMCAKYVGSSAASAASERSLALDLNKDAQNIINGLKSLGLKPDEPTLIVSEAVLFYLSPPAKRTLLKECADYMLSAPGSVLALTDNLAPFVRSAGPEEATQYLEGLGLSLKQHSSLWGGAIQFVHATSTRE